MITKVIVNKSIEANFIKELRLGLFKPEVRDLIEYWITEIEDLGYDEYLSSELFKMLGDHELNEDRQGQRSITLNQTGRLIYSIIKNAIVIRVIKITSDHNYL